MRIQVLIGIILFVASIEAKGDDTAVGEVGETKTDLNIRMADQKRSNLDLNNDTAVGNLKKNLAALRRSDIDLGVFAELAQTIKTMGNQISALQQGQVAVQNDVYRLKEASRMCQTGYVFCKKCGFDWWSGYPSRKVYFSPRFAEIPEVTMATNKLWVFQNQTEEGDLWGFDNHVGDVSTTGFKAVLIQYDVAISEQWANWIACGKVTV